jgi:hypothetical protein
MTQAIHHCCDGRRTLEYIRVAPVTVIANIGRFVGKRKMAQDRIIWGESESLVWRSVLYGFLNQTTLGRGQQLFAKLFGFPDAKSPPHPRESYRGRPPLTVSLLTKAHCREKGKWNEFQVGRLRAGLEQSSACIPSPPLNDNERIPPSGWSSLS